MQTKVQFYPDIETKYDHLLNHMNDKNKVTDQLVKTLEEICNFQFFYSKSLDSFAGTIARLLPIKDPIKDILIILERIIASKSEESQKLAKQIKQDLIPHLKTSIDQKSQLIFKQKQNNVRNIRAGMQKKLKMLFSAENNFKKIVAQANATSKSLSIPQKLKALESYRKKQDQFSDTIDSYNSTLQDYMIKYSQICEQLSQLETKRKTQFRDSITKLVVFEINYIKNLQYNYDRYMQSLNSMEGKLLVQDRILGGVEPFYNPKEQGGIIQLAKISNKNYIDSILGKKKTNQSLIAQQIKMAELRSQNPPGPISKQHYHLLTRTINPILTYVHKSMHLNLLIQIVQFSKNLYISQGKLKLTLLNALLCHNLFNDEKFWQQYQKRLTDKMVREENVANGDQKVLQKNFSNVLERDLCMLRDVQINPYITNVIKSICQKYKINSSQNTNNPPEVLKHSMSTNQNVDSALPFSVRRLSSEGLKYKNFQ